MIRSLIMSAHQFLEIALQVHAHVQARYLIAVAVEHLGRPISKESGQSDFLGLAPARMIDGGVDVRVEPVLLWRRMLPRTDRLLRYEPDLHNRLDALEAVLPGNDEPKWGAVLIRQHFVVQPDGEDRERVHRFIKAQPFDIWPTKIRSPDTRHLDRIIQRREFDEAGSGRRLQLREQVA